VGVEVSTGYALANPGEEYLVLDPGETADPFTVTLAAGGYAVQWFRVDRRETAAAGKLTVSSPPPSASPLHSVPPVPPCCT